MLVRFDAAVVFVGYGLTHATQGKIDYDDYAGVDVRGKVVLILTEQVSDPKPAIRSALADKSSTDLRYEDSKISAAVEHGASAVILVSAASGAEPTQPSAVSNILPWVITPAKLPVMTATRRLANEFLSNGGLASLDELKTTTRRIDRAALQAVERRQGRRNGDLAFHDRNRPKYCGRSARVRDASG